MTQLHRGIAVTVIQCLLVLSVAGKYAVDRERLPRAWAKAEPMDPNLPIRGRYVSLYLELDVPESMPEHWQDWVTLSARNGRLAATPASTGTGATVVRIQGDRWRLAEPVAFFIPEHVADPSRVGPGEELWVEVSVPRRGAPRPLRLAVKRHGILTPLELR